MPKSAKKKKLLNSPDGICDHFANLKVAPPIQTVTGILGYPVLSGKWEEFNHETDEMNVYCLMRMQIHNGVNEKEDFTLSWVDDKTLKIRLKWPQFMTKCMVTTTLDMTTDASGQTHPTYPMEHPLYTSMGKNAKALKDQGSIYSEGFFKFENPMVKKYEANIFPTDIYGFSTTVLQIKFFEASDEEEL